MTAVLLTFVAVKEGSSKMEARYLQVGIQTSGPLLFPAGGENRKGAGDHRSGQTGLEDCALYSGPRGSSEPVSQFRPQI